MKKVQNTIFKITGISLLCLGVTVLVYYGFFYWTQNPTMTQMQVFLRNWPYIFVGIILMLSGLVGLR